MSMDALAAFDAAATPKMDAPPPEPPPRKATPQQEAIFAAIEGQDDHVTVEALAGTGKTTTAVGCARRSRAGKKGFCAFNKHIAQELNAKLCGAATASTMHSLGFAAVRSAFGTVDMDERKMRHLLEKVRPDLFFTNKRNQVCMLREGAAIIEIARLCKLTLTDEHDEDAVWDMIGYYGVEDVPDDVDEPVIQLLEAAATGRSAMMIDYDDMIWLPVRLNLGVQQFDLLMVDECQDLSRCQQELAKLACRSGRIVPIGDRRQSLYGFTGADPDSMPRLVGDLERSARGMSSRPLTVTFRCPRSHVTLAQRLVPTLEAADWAADGEIANHLPEKFPELVEPGDLAICRCNAPLVSATFQLIAKNIPAVMLGRDFGKGLVGLIDKLRPDDAQDLIHKLRAYRDKQEQRLERRDASESAFQSLADKCNCLIHLAAENDSVGEVRTMIERLFVDQCDPSKVVRLASVHKAKGSESDRVFVLDPEIMPMLGRKTKAWERQQELNILYVALTRAKQSLYFMGDTPDPDSCRPPPTRGRKPKSPHQLPRDTQDGSDDDDEDL